MITCQISIYYTFIASSLEKFIFWNAKFQINHMVSKHGSIYLNFHKYLKLFKLFLEYICVFEYTCTLNLFPQIYSNLSCYKTKWNNFFSNILLTLYIICKNIVKLFQKFEARYTQTCTPLKSNIMWHLKKDHCSVFSLYCVFPHGFVEISVQLFLAPKTFNVNHKISFHNNCNYQSRLANFYGPQSISWLT